MSKNQETFRDKLIEKYKVLFVTDPDYAFAASRKTPEQLADLMVESLTTGSANKEGKAINQTCNDLGIKYTYSAITDYLIS